MARQSRRSRDGSLPGGGHRGRRLEELFREELNSLLDGEVADRRLEGARVSRVELTRDGSSARVWFITTGDEPEPSETHAALEHASGFLRSRLGEALPVKRLPDLRFRHDPAQVLPSTTAESDPDGRVTETH